MSLLKSSFILNTRSTILVPFTVLMMLFFQITTAKSLQSDDDEFVVVLDAGHGGHDPGNLGNGYLEKNIALNIVLNIGRILEQKPGIKVIYTRKDDTFVDLYVRGEIANKANADLFVSVHCDSHTSNAFGAGTFVLGLHANKQNFEIAKKENSVIYLEDNYETRYADYDINSPESVIGLTIMQEEFLDQSISLAKTIQDNFSNKLGRKDREVKQAGFIVLHQTFMPSVLVETGFLTNDDEGAYLNSEQGQSEMGNSIATAILNYQSGMDNSTQELAIQTNTPTPEPQSQQYDPYAVAKEVKSDESKTPEVGTTRNTNLPSVEEIVSGKLDSKPSIEEKAPEIVVHDVPETKIEKPTQKDVGNEVNKTADKITQEAEVVEAKPEPKKEIVKQIPKAQPKPKPTVVKSSTPVVSKPNVTNQAIVFKVQLLASTRDIALVASNFNGLRNLSKEPFKQFKRYMYGNTGSYRQALQLKSEANTKGYSSSYIVAYKNGVRIKTEDAIKLASE